MPDSGRERCPHRRPGKFSVLRRGTNWTAFSSSTKSGSTPKAWMTWIRIVRGSNGRHDRRRRRVSPVLPRAHRRNSPPASPVWEGSHPSGRLTGIDPSNGSAKVQHWATHPPECLEVWRVSSSAAPLLLRLDPGESDAIQLALEPGVEIILMDETDGRKAAERLQLEVRGTLGVLERGAKLGRTNFRNALSRLDQTNFRLFPALPSAFLQRNP